MDTNTNSPRFAITPDLAECKRFLEILAGSPEAEFTFQTFDDSGGGAPLARVIHGTFDDCADELISLNQDGAGIFVTVNQTDLTGRKKENITALRAVFVDDDNDSLPPLKLEPTITVDGKRGQHAYWVLEPNQDITAFESTQSALIENLGTDSKVKDLSRVMRLPGFFHKKDPANPFLIRIRSTSPKRYTIADILGIYPPTLRAARPHGAKLSDTERHDYEEFKRWVQVQPITGKDGGNRWGGRHPTLYQIIVEGLGSGFSETEILPLAEDYCARADLDEWEAERVLRSAEQRHQNDPFESRRLKKVRYMKPIQIGQFELNDQGVFLKHDVKGESNSGQPRPPEWICAPLEVVADTRDENNENWGKLLRFWDRDNKQHEWAMPNELLAGDGLDLRKELLKLGLDISPSARFLGNYLAQARPAEKARCVSRIGWHGVNFVLPERSIGPGIGGERVILQTLANNNRSLKPKGTLGEWQQHVASLCTGNSRLVFAMSAAFAAPLLHLLGDEGGGFHIRGSSSGGKTTTLKVSGSVWRGGGISGGIEKWKATVNGLESVAEAHCDTSFGLDEIGEVNPADVGNAAYMLANGSGKARANKTGGSQRRREWRVLYLSSGEVGLSDHMAQAGQKVRAGQEVRVVDIPADAGRGLGLFENIHGRPSPGQFAKELSDSTALYYGTAAIEFLEKLVPDAEAVSNRVRHARNQFVETNKPALADGQVLRVLARFALVAAAGELAASLGIVPWQAGESNSAAVACFKSWLDQRGGVQNSEADTYINQVRAFLLQHQFRFPAIETTEALPPNLAGYRNADSYRNLNRPESVQKYSCSSSDWYILPEVFKREVCNGNNNTEVARALKAHGYLDTDVRGYTKAIWLPALKQSSRFYCVKAGIVGEGNKPSDHEEIKS